MKSLTPLSVLFISTGNGARSLLAEALLRDKGSARFHARSAGIEPLPEVPKDTLELLRSEGIQIDGLHTKSVREFYAAAHIIKIDIIVTLSEEAKVRCPEWPGSPVRVHWPLDNPLAAPSCDMREWKYRKCFATLERRLSTFLKSRIAQTPSELFLQLKDIAMVVA